VANIKITDLVALTDPASTDVLPVVDIANDETKKVSIADLLENAGSGTESAPGIAFDGDSNTGIYRPGADQVAISTNGTGRLFVDANGNVGVGGVPTANGKLRINVDSGNNANLIFSEGGTDRYLLGQVTGDNALRLFDLVAVTERLRITSDGKLGLGTTSPVFKFHSNETTGSSIAGLFQTDQTESFISFAASGTTATSTVRLGATGDDLIAFVNGGERMRIDSSGRLGLGTSSPVESLHLGGSSAQNIRINGNSNALYLGTAGDTCQVSANRRPTDGTIPNSARGTAFINVNGLSTGGSIELATSTTANTGATTAMTIDSSQRVGIGTTSPSSSLHISDSATVQARLISSGASTGILFSDAATTDSVTIGTVGDELRFRTDQGAYTFRTNNGASEAVRIDSSGRLLVGTSTDSGGALLQVNGNRVRIATAKTPASASDTGTAGEICWDADYIYVAVGTNTWKRAALSTW